MSGLDQPARGRYPVDPGVAGAAMPRRARGRRVLRRAVRLMLALIAILAVGAATIMLATPSVGNAWSLAGAQARSHHAAFPGPPVPARFAAALISTEDHRFASEPGFDPFALWRATLYQQLAKLLYGPHKGRLTVELYEVALGVKLKFSYTREQILRMYADVAYFGHGYYGLTAASCGYFGRQSARLSWPQSAVLAGLVQAPSAYDPLEHPDLARSREGHVMSRLVATGALTPHQAAAALAVPIDRLLAPARGCRA